MIRLIHIADVHLDACFASEGVPPRIGDRCRANRFAIFEAALRRAVEWHAHAVLIPGDLFEADRVTRATLAAVRDVIASAAPIPVLIAPGNRDPYGPESPYAAEDWPGNAYIFTEPVWSSRTLEAIALSAHGIAAPGNGAPLPPLRIAGDKRVHIALAHATERTQAPPESKSFALFDWNAFDLPELHYLALGHVHVPLRIEGPKHVCMAYPGAPDPLRYGGAQQGCWLEVEIDETCDTVHVRETPSARTRFTELALPCGGMTSTDAIVNAIRAALPEPDRTNLGRVTLTDATHLRVAQEFSSIQEAASEGWDWLEVHDRTSRAESYDAIARETTALGGFAAEMLRYIETAPNDSVRHACQRALELGVGALRGALPPVHTAAEEPGLGDAS